MRDKVIDLMQAMGIARIVIGHYYIPTLLKYPSSGVWMPAFFFMSGYYFKSFDQFSDKLVFIFKKTKELLVPYFLYYIGLTICCYFLELTLSIHLIGLGWDYDPLRFVAVLLLKPFFGGISVLFVASWFITDLWLVHIVMQLIYNNEFQRRKIDIIYFILFLILAFFGIYWSFSSPLAPGLPKPPNIEPLRDHPMLKLVLIRLSFNLFFYFCGMAYQKYIGKYQQIIFRKTFLLPAWSALFLLKFVYKGDFDYLVFNADYRSAPCWLPLAAASIGIYALLLTAKYLSKYVDDDGILILVSRETYHSMCQHMLVFLCLNILKISISHPSDFNVLDWNPFYMKNPEFDWVIYTILGVLVPTFVTRFIRKLSGERRQYGFPKKSIVDKLSA